MATERHFLDVAVVRSQGQPNITRDNYLQLQFLENGDGWVIGHGRLAVSRRTGEHKQIKELRTIQRNHAVLFPEFGRVTSRNRLLDVFKSFREKNHVELMTFKIPSFD
jgi:hypothetical protein